MPGNWEWAGLMWPLSSPWVLCGTHLVLKEWEEEKLKGEALALRAASSRRRLACSLVCVSSLPCLSLPKQASGWHSEYEWGSGNTLLSLRFNNSAVAQPLASQAYFLPQPVVLQTSGAPDSKVFKNREVSNYLLSIRSKYSPLFILLVIP